MLYESPCAGRANKQTEWESLKLREYDETLDHEPDECPDECCRGCHKKNCWNCPIMGAETHNMEGA